jgi:hypothetical protein
MKNYLKLIPFVIFIIAIAGAFATNTKIRSQKTLALVQGYIQGGPAGTICQVSIMCSTDYNQLCKVGTTQVWGKDAAGKCTLEVYKVPE